MHDTKKVQATQCNSIITPRELNNRNQSCVTYLVKHIVLQKFRKQPFNSRRFLHIREQKDWLYINDVTWPEIMTVQLNWPGIRQVLQDAVADAGHLEHLRTSGRRCDSCVHFHSGRRYETFRADSARWILHRPGSATGNYNLSRDNYHQLQVSQKYQVLAGVFIPATPSECSWKYQRTLRRVYRMKKFNLSLHKGLRNGWSWRIRNNYLCIEMDLDKLSETTGIIVPHRLCISKSLKQRIGWKTRNIRNDFRFSWSVNRNHSLRPLRGANNLPLQRLWRRESIAWT